MKRSREPGSPVKLYVDGMVGLQAGEYIRTRAGSCYLVQSLRPSPSRPQRRYLACVRWPLADVPADARCWELVWYRRPKKKVRP